MTTTLQVAAPRALTLFPDEEYNDFRELCLPACRYWCGDFFEELTVQAFGGQRLAVVSNCICPDIRLAGTTYLEVKSIGKSNTVLVYTSRLDKDLSHDDKEVVYCFWNHGAPMRDGMLLGQLRDDLSRSVKSVTLVSARTLAAILADFEVRSLGPAPSHWKRGYGSNGYTHYWQVRLSHVTRRLQSAEVDLSRAAAYGRVIGTTIPMYMEADQTWVTALNTKTS